MPPSLVLRKVPRFTRERTASAEIPSSEAASDTVKRGVRTYTSDRSVVARSAASSGGPVFSSPTVGVSYTPLAGARRPGDGSLEA